MLNLFFCHRVIFYYTVGEKILVVSCRLYKEFSSPKKLQMEQYGNPIDASSPQREEMYDLVSNYFDNPTMTKVKDVEQFSMYMAKVSCKLMAENRYLVAFVERNDSTVGTSYLLRELYWVSFETCSNTDFHRNLMTISYTPKKYTPFDSPLEIKDRQTTHSTYTCNNYPQITVTLLHKSGDLYEYPNTGRLCSAFETYRTIFTFT